MLKLMQVNWQKIACYIAAFAIIFLLGQLHGERKAAKIHTDYIKQQANAIVKTVEQEAKIVVKTEIEYRDKIKKIYIKGDEIEKTVYKYISPAISDSVLITNGFVRIHNAAWTSTPAGTPSITDNEPAGISLIEVAETETHNATSCRAWREQALGLRAFYADLRKSRSSE